MGRPISLDYAGPRARRGVLGQWNYTLPVHGDGDLFPPGVIFPIISPIVVVDTPTPPHPQKMFSSLFYFILLVGIN